MRRGICIGGWWGDPRRLGEIISARALPSPVETVRAEDLAGEAGLAEALWALNNAHAVELSWLAEGALAGLVARAFWAGRVGAAAMLIAFD